MESAFNSSVSSTCIVVHPYNVLCFTINTKDLIGQVVSRGTVCSSASSYAAMRMMVGSRPVLVMV